MISGSNESQTVNGENTLKTTTRFPISYLCLCDVSAWGGQRKPGISWSWKQVVVSHLVWVQGLPRVPRVPADLGTELVPSIRIENAPSSSFQLQKAQSKACRKSCMWQKDEPRAPGRPRCPCVSRLPASALPLDYVLSPCLPFVILKEGLIKWPRLFLNSVCSPDGP